VHRDAPTVISASGARDARRRGMRMLWIAILVGCSHPAPAGDDANGGKDGEGMSDAGSDGTAASVWHPHPPTSWQWQLEGTIDTSFDVAMYDIDLIEGATVIDQLHADGRIVLCYFSAGSYEPGRPDSGDFPAQSLGNVLDGWPDERWLDTRSAAVRQIMRARLDRAVASHCDGVEPDNVDGFQNNSGFPLTASTQLDYNRFLATEAHTRKLSVGLKNDIDQAMELVGDFDWALNEQCFQFDECDKLAPFIDADKAVFQVEYGSATLAQTVCPKANAANFDTLIKPADMSVTASRIACR
jgi:hypothetical protein